MLSDRLKYKISMGDKVHYMDKTYGVASYIAQHDYYDLVSLRDSNGEYLEMSDKAIKYVPTIHVKKIGVK